MNDDHDNAAADKAILERLSEPDQITEDALREHAAQRPTDKALQLAMDARVRKIDADLRYATRHLKSALAAERELDDLFEEFGCLPGREALARPLQLCRDILDMAESLRRQL